jgi:cyclic 2,3-diphosphoglycerate synthase
MRRSAVALIDGEHYPPVVVAALGWAADRFDFRAALFLGGTEKIHADDLELTAEKLYGLPVVFDSDPIRGLVTAMERFRPEVVVDLSDEPVLGYEERFRLISESLAHDVGYVGPDFHFSPANPGRLCTSPSLAVIGTGKRVGKTAVSGFVARTIQGASVGPGAGPGEQPAVGSGPPVVVVAMGRGGPAEPEIVDGAAARLQVADLLGFSRRGRHAASDHFEDAVLSRVVTVGCRRCGGGMAGVPFFSNVAEGVRLANELQPGFMILEGSGAAQPPVEADARLLVVGAHQPVGHIVGYLGAYRLLISDGVVLTMAERPSASPEKVRAILEAVREVKPGLPVVPVVFRPEPAEDVRGSRVAFFSTAPATQGAGLAGHLEERWGCRVELVSTELADRAALRRALQDPAMRQVEVVLTEIKAASIDVVAEEAAARGLRVVFVDNVPVEVPPARAGDLIGLVESLKATARDRFERRV